MPTSTLKKYYDQEYFDELCRKQNVPMVFGYYAWLLNEGTGAGEDIIKSVVKFRKEVEEMN